MKKIVNFLHVDVEEFSSVVRWCYLIISCDSANCYKSGDIQYVENKINYFGTSDVRFRFMYVSICLRNWIK